MKKLFLVSIFVLLLCGSFAHGQSTFAVKILRVLDGDTVDFVHSDGMTDRIRMSGVDAPEVARSKREISQPFGEKCKAFLQTLIEGITVTVAALKNRDLYGRVLGRILLQDGEDINLMTVKSGCVWLTNPNGIPAQFRADYTAAFEKARAEKIGLFSSEDAVTPSVWRKKKQKYLKRTRGIL